MFGNQKIEERCRTRQSIRARNCHNTIEPRERNNFPWSIATVMIVAVVVIAIVPTTGAAVTTVLGVFAAMLRGR